MNNWRALACAVATLITAFSATTSRAETIRLDLNSVEMADRTSVIPDMLGTTLAVEMTPESRHAFATFSRSRVGEVIHVRLGLQIVSSPRLVTPITGGRIHISGFENEEDARRAQIALSARVLFVEIDGSDK